MSTQVKICGITNLTDALAARDAGADFLGFIFFPGSQRAVTVREARQIAQSLRQQPGCPTLVGVFVNAGAEQVADVLDDCGLDLAQLNGEETPSLIGEPASPLYRRSYKVLRPSSLEEAEADAEWFLPPEPQPGQPTLLLDTFHPTLRGGTGRRADWDIAALLAKQVSGLMLAGGLNPENVTEAVCRVRPFAVDVASGIEAEPGRKDLVRLRRFIERAKAA